MKPRSYHVRAVAAAQAVCDHAYGQMGNYAISHGHGNVRLTELRQMPEYKDLFWAIDEALVELYVAQRAAITDHVAWRETTQWGGDRFEFYSVSDARKWQRDARKRAV